MRNIFFKIFILLSIGVISLMASVDFNSASKEELMSIKGIGEKKAISIIEYRKSHKIQKIDDLKNIKGFGDKLVAKIKTSSK